MPKRFIATELWSEDWFLEMPSEYKLFWYYMLSKCDHAGLFKPNMRSFCVLNGANLTPNEVISYFNNGKDRIKVISDSTWFIEDFFVFQYGTTFNENNRVHESVGKEWEKNKIEKKSIRGLLDLKDRVKEKEKEKEKEKDKIGSLRNKKDGNFEKSERSRLTIYKTTEKIAKDILWTNRDKIASYEFSEIVVSGGDNIININNVILKLSNFPNYLQKWASDKITVPHILILFTLFCDINGSEGYMYAESENDGIFDTLFEEFKKHFNHLFQS